MRDLDVVRKRYHERLASERFADLLNGPNDLRGGRWADSGKLLQARGGNANQIDDVAVAVLLKDPNSNRRGDILQSVDRHLLEHRLVVFVTKTTNRVSNCGVRVALGVCEPIGELIQLLNKVRRVFANGSLFARSAK
ncbi:hypothetical protein LOC68_01655 [Blastopirellula sp. JC732]|uniref:Uncharacterized protein n=1 Tax=Blastopirellula sediminis TaxID=2894196 RepID=A0A9X1SDW5_9BACT|nr:hypothetical protein [Blastopirellula sediminis]MCC9608107.1 hypothetical protein [Blastopirellula sediminis]MCC9627100.1 hypothetical protein [Blastopirellula sediminis]